LVINSKNKIKTFNCVPKATSPGAGLQKGQIRDENDKKKDLPTDERLSGQESRSGFLRGNRLGYTAMIAAKQEDNKSEEEVAIRGELARRLIYAPFRVLSIVTGFFLLRGLVSLVVRYCFILRRYVTLTVEGSSLVVNMEWSILGRRFRHIRTVAPISQMPAVRLENRQRYVHLLIGFGALAIGTWVGIQWFVDGLRAGYPYLALVGAGVVVLGIAVDLFLYILVPAGKGRSLLLLAMGPWTMRVSGVEHDAARRFLDRVGDSWKTN
jgi:hypothetical protein